MEMPPELLIVLGAVLGFLPGLLLWWYGQRMAAIHVDQLIKAIVGQAKQKATRTPDGAFIEVGALREIVNGITGEADYTADILLTDEIDVAGPPSAQPGGTIGAQSSREDNAAP